MGFSAYKVCLVPIYPSLYKGLLIPPVSAGIDFDGEKETLDAGNTYKEICRLFWVRDFEVCHSDASANE